MPIKNQEFPGLVEDSGGRIETAVSMWLWGVALLVFAMIVVGGATRLTDSGLSITEWLPLLGAIPPLSEADWQIAFEKYRQIPEYELVNQGMSLDEFKFIYWWEWAHRFLGRFIGVAFALPLIGFWLAGKLKKGSAPKFIGLFALGGLQGAIGWYMVSSGLVDRIDVSPYRLALHLTVAFAILGWLVWLALDEGRNNYAVTGEATSACMRRFAAVIVGLVLLQVVLGGFVAGQKAGLVFNTWPDMNGYLFPPGYWLEPWWLSFFERHGAVQFNHRLLAYLLVACAIVQAVWAARTFVDNRIRLAATVLAVAVVLQMIAGIATVIYGVPLWLGLIHQGSGALVMAIAVWHLFVVCRAGVVPRDPSQARQLDDPVIADPA